MFWKGYLGCGKRLAGFWLKIEGSGFRMQDADEAAEVICALQPWAVQWRDAGGRTAMHWASLRASTAVIEVR